MYSTIYSCKLCIICIFVSFGSSKPTNFQPKPCSTEQTHHMVDPCNYKCRPKPKRMMTMTVGCFSSATAAFERRPVWRACGENMCLSQSGRGRQKKISVSIPKSTIFYLQMNRERLREDTCISFASCDFIIIIFFGWALILVLCVRCVLVRSLWWWRGIVRMKNSVIDWEQRCGDMSTIFFSCSSFNGPGKKFFLFHSNSSWMVPFQFFFCLFATIEFDMRKWMKFFCGLFVTGERWVRTHFHIYTLHTQTWMQPSCMDDKSGWDAALCLHFIKSTRIFHFTYISFPIRASRPDTPAQLYIYNFIQKYLIVNWWRRKKTNKTNEDGPKSSFCKVFEVSNLLRINWKTEFFMWHILWWWIGTEIEAWGRTHTQTYAWQLKGGNST